MSPASALDSFTFHAMGSLEEAMTKQGLCSRCYEKTLYRVIASPEGSFNQCCLCKHIYVLAKAGKEIDHDRA